MTDLVIDQGGADGGAQAEALAQAAGGIVFATPFPDGEVAAGPHPALARIETEHDFTEGELVELASGRGLDREAHGERLRIVTY